MLMKLTNPETILNMQANSINSLVTSNALNADDIHVSKARN